MRQCGDQLDLRIILRRRGFEENEVLATHRSRHQLLTGQLDASIADELHPERRDASLNLYDVANANQPPYDNACNDLPGIVGKINRSIDRIDTMLTFLEFVGLSYG